MQATEIEHIVLKSSVLRRALEEIESGKNVIIKGLAGSLKALFLAVLFERKQTSILYLTADEEQEEVVKEDLELLVGSDRIARMPHLREFLTDHTVIDSTRKGQLLSMLEKLVERQHLITIISAKNICLQFPSPEWIRKQRILIETGKDYNFDFLRNRLAELGFNREAMVENWGEMSIRGGIIDIYPFSSEYPYRIEFFGDSVESIRIFDPITQRSLQHISQVLIYPQYSEEPHEFQVPTVSLFDYFDKNTIIFQDETELIKKDIEESFNFYGESIEKNNTHSENVCRSHIALNIDYVYQKLNGFVIIDYNSLISDNNANHFNIASQAQESLKGNLQLLKQKIEFYSQKSYRSHDGYQIYFLCDSSEQLSRIEDILSDAGIDCDAIQIKNLGINQGFIFPEVGLVVFTDNQFYGRPLRWRRRKTVRHGLTLQQLNSLSIGDYVVHVDHGIGQYQGLKKITVQRNERECLSILYREGDYLYVPLDRMDRVQKYSAKEGVIPSLSKLGSKDWERLKTKTKKHIKVIARELIELYAKRKTQTGFAFSKDTLWQKELEASFEFEDTPDQRKSTEEIKQDMENDFPMDRLVCGDVGYGKTEVAVRAAFKATNDSKQVAVLVPTTILALQHYSVFRERLGRFPVKIEMLSRFRTPSEQKRIIEWLKLGKIDVIIGTHRLLSNDVQFRDLGLMIVDEEHRFGVRNKERLKQFQVNVDVLSMSATPIPRTLNMALLGIRDMSIIATPPRDRLPIQTEVIVFDKKVIRMAILKEVERGGQVFFVHNRVQSIESVANFLRRVVPEVSFVVAHGQMDERQLEKVMWDFATRKYHCLVSTMIIESGLDIPNVNTLIVNRADRFGLSQLYQLRGRVGRSNQRAYAYLLVPPLNLLTRSTLKRLQIIEEFSDLGAGFNIAMRDLEIRGAGNIFGAEQSGHIIALGYEMYHKIIEEAIRELKLEREGKSPSEIIEKEETRVEIDQDAYLPDDYIAEPELKVDIYRRLAQEQDLTLIDQIREEIRDRFGSLPIPARNLFNLVELKMIGNLMNFKLVKIINRSLVLYFSKDVTSQNNRELMEKKVCSIMEKVPRLFHFVQEGKTGPGLHVDIPKNEPDPIEYSKNILKRLL